MLQEHRVCLYQIQIVKGLLGTHMHNLLLISFAIIREFDKAHINELSVLLVICLNQSFQVRLPQFLVRIVINQFTN